MFFVLLFAGIALLVKDKLFLGSRSGGVYKVQGSAAKVLGAFALFASTLRLFAIAGVIPTNVDVGLLECGALLLVLIMLPIIGQRPDIDDPVDRQALGVASASLSVWAGRLALVLGSLVGAFAVTSFTSLASVEVGRIIFTSLLIAWILILLLTRRPSAHPLVFADELKGNIVGGLFLGFVAGFLGETFIQAILKKLSAG